LANIDTYLANRTWFGAELSYVDFLAWEFFDHIALVFPKMLNENENIMKFYKRFANLPKIFAYIETDEFQTAACYGPAARYAGSLVKIKRGEKMYY